jgi:hypothetical protein
VAEAQTTEAPPGSDGVALKYETGSLLLHRVIGKDEEARYQHLRRAWRSNERIVLFGYFQLQPVVEHPRLPPMN